jgi:hypothetical protein
MSNKARASKTGETRHVAATQPAPNVHVVGSPVFRQPASPIEIVQRAQADPRSLDPAGVMLAQRTLGNRAVNQLLEPRRSGISQTHEARLTVGAAHDSYEQEADRVAEQVMSDLGGDSPVGIADNAIAHVQRDVIQRKVEVLPAQFFEAVTKEIEAEKLAPEKKLSHLRAYVYLEPVNKTGRRTLEEEVDYTLAIASEERKLAVQAAWDKVQEDFTKSDVIGLETDLPILANVVNEIQATVPAPGEPPLKTALLSILQAAEKESVDFAQVKDLITSAKPVERAQVGSDEAFLTIAYDKIKPADLPDFVTTLGVRERGKKRDMLRVRLLHLLAAAQDNSIAFSKIKWLFDKVPGDSNAIKGDIDIYKFAWEKVKPEDLQQVIDLFTVADDKRVAYVFQGRKAITFEQLKRVFDRISPASRKSLSNTYGHNIRMLAGKDPSLEETLAAWAKRPPKPKKGGATETTEEGQAPVTIAPAKQMRHPTGASVDRLILATLGDFLREENRVSKIAGHVAVLREDAYKKVVAQFEKSPQALPEAQASTAFQHEGRIFINADKGDPGTLIHEGCHQFAPDDFKNTFGNDLNEGVNEYFARKAMSGLPYFPMYRSEYAKQFAVASALVDALSEPVVAHAYFQAKIEDELKTKFTTLRHGKGDPETDWSNLKKYAKEEKREEFRALLTA